MIKIVRSVDEFSQEEWTFHVLPYRMTAGLVLTHYGISRRKQRNFHFLPPRPADRWDSGDERHFHSGLERPSHIPHDVIEEAKGLALKDVFIGWASESARYRG